MVEEQRHGFHSHEWIVFTLGLAGIFIGTLIFSYYISYTPYPYAAHSLLFFLEEKMALAAGNALMATLAAAILLWAFYEISVKHNHPRWHKIFFLTAGSIVSTGVFLLFTSLTLLFLISTQEVLYTVAAALLIGGIFAASIIAMELTYTLLRRKYESIAPKHPGRMFFWGIAIGLICATMLLLAVWQAQVLVIKGVNQELQHIAVAKQEYVDAARSVTEALPSSAFKEALEEKVAAAQATEITPLPPPTFTEVLQDSVIETRCEALQESTRPLYTLLRAVRQMQQPDAQADTAIISSPVRYKPFDDLMTCVGKSLAMA